MELRNNVWILIFLGLLPVKLTVGGTVRTTTPQTAPDDEQDWKTIQYWPNGEIPFLIPNNTYSEKQLATIEFAMKRWEYKTCIKFVPWTEDLHQKLGEERYVKFYADGNCFSEKGMDQRQPQLIGIGKRGCVSMALVIHELGHTIGMIHPMERNDRDYYITVQSENVNPGSTRSYMTSEEKNLEYNFFNTPYDYKSIMHYGERAWSNGNGPTMVTTDPAYQNVIGKASDVSFFDALYVNRAYNCDSLCSKSLQNCSNGGFRGGKDCHCICPDGYTGDFCEVLLPGYRHIVNYKCQTGWIYESGRCYKFYSNPIPYEFAMHYCSVSNNATLVIIKSRREMDTFTRLAEEQLGRTSMESYWIGINRKAGESAQWLDGTAIDQNVVAPRLEVDNNDTELCGYFDGSGVALTTCMMVMTRGAVCVKDFDPTCGGRYYISETGRILQSPGFPVEYPEKIECQYILQSQEKTKISLTFTNFSLETDCSKYYLEVQLTSDITQEGIRYCGMDLQNKTLVSDSNLAVLTFITKSIYNPLQGFQVTAHATPTSTWTTPSPFTLLDAISKTLKQAKTQPGNEKLTLSGIWNLIKSMAFSKIL